jgi:hypothetical protein
MLFIKILLLLGLSSGLELLFSKGAWAWGPGIHTVISCRLLEDTIQTLPFIGTIIKTWPLEFLYGNLAADFLVGKGFKKRQGHSHNWETGLRLLEEASENRQISYACGFMSHLAADIMAHNYFIPNLIHSASTWRRMGHIYWEIRADRFVDQLYLKIAKEVLSQERLDLDEMLKWVMGKSGAGFRTRKRLYTRSITVSNSDRFFNSMNLVVKKAHYQIPSYYLSFMIDLSFRAARDLLIRPNNSPLFAYDPIGSRNLALAGRHAMRARFFRLPRSIQEFQVAEDLLKI